MKGEEGERDGLNMGQQVEGEVNEANAAPLRRLKRPTAEFVYI